MPPTIASYDAVPYESHPYPDTHPGRLYMIAKLFGLNPTPITRCRVLELGCAAGGNIRAQILIGREVEVGVDLVADASLVLSTARPGDARTQRSSSARLKETPQ